MRLLLLGLAAGILLGTSILYAVPTPFTVSGRRLLRAGQPFTIQGVNYSPTPVRSTVGNPPGGCNGPYQWWTDRAAYIADFPLIHQMGANTIRTFNLMNSTATATQVLQALDVAQANSLYVVMGFFVSGTANLSDATVQASLQSQFLAAVETYMNHPAVLMWVLGNEQNLTANGNNASWYQFVNHVAGLAKAIDPRHPVATVEGECPQCTPPLSYNIGNAAVMADDLDMNNLDLWGLTAYRGPTFQGLFDQLISITTKPVYVAEFGKDAFRDAVMQEDQSMQATHLNSQWQEIAAHLSASSATLALAGATVFEWTDEWWKDMGAGSSCFAHDTEVIFTRSQDSADPNYNDEWFGVASIVPIDAITNPFGTVRSLRQGYYTLQSFWNPQATASTSRPSSFFSDTVRNFPNPFRAGSAPTKFVAFASEAGTIEIHIFDASGQFVVSLPAITTTGAGRYELNWDGKNSQGETISSGLYFARIEGRSAVHHDRQYRRVVAVK